MRLALHLWLVVLGPAWWADALPRDYRGAVDGKEEKAVAVDGDPNEPTCDELRDMWRFSKRQSRTPEITNEIPTYRDPFAVNVWDDYAQPRSAGRIGVPRPLVFGKIITLPKVSDHSPERIKAFQEVFTNPDLVVFGSSNSRRKNNFHRHGGGGGVRPLPPHSQGGFQHLKELIRNERARELQEQRLTEEAERLGAGSKDLYAGGGAGSAKYPYGRLNEGPPSAVDNVIIRNRPPPVGGGSRRTAAGYPPEYLVARYLEDVSPPSRPYGPYAAAAAAPANPHIAAMNKYKPQFPDTSLVSEYF
ncbi:Hypothetical protein NTJ_02675 [Nesidiocoris tenuis]|uniref:Uncharacterized protein n=1 Tax=Nesidiocoris tenuis TaxID=355587 RepID=A0ABN7AF57_9HEMI|nr:Hypothetical protein NTJ_02675 [Nesidiocoris tenuis]